MTAESEIARLRDEVANLARKLGAEVATTQRLRRVIRAAQVAVQFGRVLSAHIKEDYDRDPHVERFDAVADEFDAAIASGNGDGK